MSDISLNSIRHSEQNDLNSLTMVWFGQNFDVHKKSKFYTSISNTLHVIQCDIEISMLPLLLPVTDKHNKDVIDQPFKS